MVPKVRFELTRPYGHYALNVARLPFRHFGSKAHYGRAPFSVQPEDVRDSMVGGTGLEPVASSV